MYLFLKSVGAQKQRGDTLVEVLISIAVVSLILGGAYTTTNRSLQATRAAQERSVALKLAESQIERIKGLAASNPTALFAAASPFCISGNTGQPVAATHADCSVNETGAPTSSEPIFRLSIERTGNNFKLTETWFNVSGRVQDKLELRYRVYE